MDMSVITVTCSLLYTVTYLNIIAAQKTLYASPIQQLVTHIL